MTTLNQLEDLFIQRTFWDGTWVKTVADWTVTPLIDNVERAGTGLAMSGALVISERVREEMDNFTSAAYSLGEIACAGTEAAIEALFEPALAVFIYWQAGLTTEQKAWVERKLIVHGMEKAAEFRTSHNLKKLVKKRFCHILLRKSEGVIEMAASLKEVLDANDFRQARKATFKALETIARDAKPEKGRWGLGNAPYLKLARFLSWIPYTTEQSMVEASRFRRTYPNVWKKLQQELPGRPYLYPRDWNYLFFLFGRKLDLLLSFAEDGLAGRTPRFVLG